MNCHICRLGVAATMAAVCLLLLCTSVVHAQAGGPGTLIGEDMIATSFQASSSFCNYYPVNYSVSGPAAGPYSGSFNQYGVFYASQPPSDTRFDAHFRGTFHIDSAFGAVDGFGEADIPYYQLTCSRVTDPNGNLIGRLYRGNFNIGFSASVAAFPSCQLHAQAFVNLLLFMDPSGTTVL